MPIDQKLTDRTEAASASEESFIHIVEPSDISQSPEGSSYKINKENYLKEDRQTVENLQIEVDGKADIAYVDSLVVGLWDDRGTFDASVNAYPSSGGSGSAGAIKKGDIWTVSVAGVLPTSQNVEVGDVVRALIDTPANTQSNWAIQQNNIGYTAENSANKSTDIEADKASNTKYSSVKSIYDWAVSKFNSIVLGFVTETTTSRTLVLTDASKQVNFTNNTSIGKDLVVPLNSSVAFPTGTRIAVTLKGNHANDDYNIITVSGSGITFIAPNGLIVFKNGKVILTKEDIDTWRVELIPSYVLSSVLYLKYGLNLRNFNLVASYIGGDFFYTNTGSGKFADASLGTYLKPSGLAATGWETSHVINEASDQSANYTSLSLPNKGHVASLISAAATPDATDTVKGKAKLYDDLSANNTDGAVTQNAVALLRDEILQTTRRVLYNNTTLSSVLTGDTEPNIVYTATIPANTLSASGFALFLEATMTQIPDIGIVPITSLFISNDIGSLGSKIGMSVCDNDTKQVSTIRRTVYYNGTNLYAKTYPDSDALHDDAVSSGTDCLIATIDITEINYIHFVLQNNDVFGESKISHALCEYIPSLT